MGLILLFLQVQHIDISYQLGIHLFIDGLVLGDFFGKNQVHQEKKPKV